MVRIGIWFTNQNFCPFVPMDHDVLRRTAIQKAVSNQIQSVLTSSLALSVAAKFSGGAKCQKAEGPYGHTKKGTFNICYWVQVEGNEKWVVRFPLLGMHSLDMIVSKMDSEIATLKFLNERTSVRVPRLIGFGLGDDDSPVPFIIMQHVEGLPLNIYWKRYGDNPKFVKGITKSLAQQYCSLLRHPFDRVGSLRLTKDRDGWEIGSAPLSIDQFDLFRDGLKFTPSNPISSSEDYYLSQSRLFERYINEQRNSVFDEEDALQKYVTPEVFRQVIPHYMQKKFNNGPFFLCHLDLHASNIMTNKNLEVEAILDWECASVLPFEVACAPPRCLTAANHLEDLKPGSLAYSAYVSRLQLFTTQVQSVLASVPMPCVANDDVIMRLNTAFTEKGAFFAWAATDIRNMYFILWDHIALTTPMFLNKSSHTHLEQQYGVMFESEQELVDAVLEKSDASEVREWVVNRLSSLASYRVEKDMGIALES